LLAQSSVLAKVVGLSKRLTYPAIAGYAGCFAQCIVWVYEQAVPSRPRRQHLRCKFWDVVSDNPSAAAAAVTQSVGRKTTWSCRRNRLLQWNIRRI